MRTFPRFDFDAIVAARDRPKLALPAGLEWYMDSLNCGVFCMLSKLISIRKGRDNVVHHRQSAVAIKYRNRSSNNTEATEE